MGINPVGNKFVAGPKIRYNASRCESVMNSMLSRSGAAWPSGKAEDCKSFIPSSNLGAAFKGFERYGALSWRIAELLQSVRLPS